MTYNAILVLQARIPAQLDKCWTQDPVLLEDALGRVTPFHVEFIDSWEVRLSLGVRICSFGLLNKVFDAVFEARFRQCPGHRKIIGKEYALRSNIHRKDIERTVDFRRCFLPGLHVDMSMIFVRSPLKCDVCPGCNFPSPESQECRLSDIEWYNNLAPALVEILTC